MPFVAHREPEHGSKAYAPCDISSVHNAFLGRLWDPAKGITFEIPPRNNTWNPSTKITFSNATLSCLVHGSKRDKSCRRKEVLSTVPAANERLIVLSYVSRRGVSSEALFPPDLPTDSSTEDYGLGRYFGDDSTRRPIVPKKSKAMTSPSTQNRKGPPSSIATKRSSESIRHSLAQLAKSTVDSRNRLLLGKHTQPDDRDAMRDTRTSSRQTKASRASAVELISRNNHAEGAGMHSAHGVGEQSTTLNMPTKDAMAALVPIVLYPAEQPRTVDIVSQLATADEFANREVAILQAENDEKGNFTASETKGTSVKREYEESCFPDTPISIARGVVAQSQARSARRTPLQKESSAPSMESETFDNEVDRSFSDAQRWFLDLEDQYLKLRRIFEPSDRGWTTIRISLEEVRKEVSNSATSKRVQSRLELMLYEIMVLVTEYYARTHNYRRLRQYRDRLDQYSLLSDARKYILLRDVREYMTQALVDHCKQGYHSLKYCILQYRCLREQRLGVEWRWKESPWSIIADHRYRHAFPNELILPARDSYQLFLFVYHCPADMCLHRAAMHVGTVNRGLAEIKHQLFTDIRGLWTTCWVKQGYTMNDNSLRFIHLMDRKVMKPGFLLSGLRDYEEICVRRSRYDPLAVLKENSAIMPAMGPMSKEMDHLRLQHESSTPSYTSLSSSNCARDEESASDLAFEQSLTTNTSLGISIHGHDKRAKTVTDTRGPVILVPPPPLRLSPSPNHASSGSSGRIVMGNKVVRTSPDKTKVASHADDQCKLQSFHTPLSYQIPEAKLKEAMLASRSTGPAYWQYSLYENSVGERVKVHYCKSKQTTESIAKWFLDKEVIGFDIEWKPNAQYSDGIRKNVSLIQLASEERIALFHIAKFSQGDTLSDLLAPTLKAIMEDPKISKVGVSVKSDCTRLRRSLGIEARGLFELSHLYKLVKYSANEAKKIDKKLVALAKQVEEHLQLPLWKGDVRSSDWSQPLNYQQIQYAASDSYAGLQLYDVMEGKRKALEPTPPRPEHAELDLPIRLATGEKINTAEEPDPSIETASTADTPLPGIEEMARDFLQISIEDKDENKLSKKQYSGRPFEIIKAETWIRKWRSELPQPKGSKAGLASLRAYSLWHHQALEVLDAASLLRNPPLQNSTVASYILEAIRIENLPYESTRLSGLFKHLPEGGKMRYKALRDRINLSIDLGRG